MKTIVIKQEDRVWRLLWTNVKRRNKNISLVIRFRRNEENYVECEISRIKMCLFVEKRQYGW